MDAWRGEGRCCRGAVGFGMGERSDGDDDFFQALLGLGREADNSESLSPVTGLMSFKGIMYFYITSNDMSPCVLLA